MPVNNPTLLTSGTIIASSTSRSSTSVSPTADALLFISLSTQRIGGGSPTLTSTSIQSTYAGAGPWVELAAHADSSVVAHISAYSQMGGSPGSGAITVNYNNTTSSIHSWAVYELTGHSSATPISESTFGESTTPNIRTIVGLAAGNLLLNCVGAAIGNTPTLVGDTDLSTLIQVGTAGCITGVYYDPDDDESSATVTITGVHVDEPIASILAEIAAADTGAAAAVAFVLELRERHYPRGHLRGAMRGAVHFSLPQIVSSSPQLSV